MKRLISILLLSGILTALSCSRQEEVRGTGYLTVQIRSDAAPEVVVKSAGEPDPVFSLTVVSRETGAETTVADARSLAADPLVLPAGEYTVRATSGTDAEAAWNAPFYAGSADILVKPEQTTEAEVTCTLANVMVTVAFEDRTDDLFTDYRVTVDNGRG